MTLTLRLPHCEHTSRRCLGEDHVVPGLQFQERLHRLMVAVETMDREARLAAGYARRLSH
jgi:hypothetical protein